MVLVTGATGFLGSELVKQLLPKGDQVRAIKRGPSVIPDVLKNESLIEWVNADLLDYFSLEEAIQGISTVYHCAAFVSLKPGDKKEMRKVNIEGTINLLNVCSAYDVQKLLHVSSVAALGKSKKGELITEKDHWEFGQGQSGYSISKYESEMEVFRAAAEGLNAIIVNPSIIIGKNAGMEGSGQFFETVKNGLSYYPDGSFGFVDVQDVARAMILLMESDISGRRFIISAENWTYRDFFTAVALQLNKKPPSIALKPWMIDLARVGNGILSAFTGKRDTLSRDAAKSAFKKQNFSNERIKKALNLEFRSINKSISEICQNLSTN
ncbi:MAG: NAD-dependent epimerase/dehydratase family protein [Daejeonella sp.]